MTVQFGRSDPPSGGALAGLQRGLRIMTFVVVILGGAFILYKHFTRKAPPPPPPVETATAAPVRAEIPPVKPGEVTIDLTTSPLLGDNATAPVAPPPADNGVAAIVGLDGVKDGALIERQPLYYLLREVEDRFPADDLFMKRAPAVSLAELKAKPQDYRGKPLTVRGRVARVERSALPPNPSGVRFALEGEIVVPGQGLCMFITSRVTRMSVGSDVTFHGLFVKLVMCQTNEGVNELIPLVVASHPETAVAAKPGGGGAAPGGFGDTWLIGVVVALVVLYGVLQFAMRRRGAGQNRAVEARRRARELLNRTGGDEPSEIPGAGNPQAFDKEGNPLP